jgi:hypothetical protein
MWQELMTGRHSKRRTHTRVPAQREPGIELVDARTKVAHQVSAEALLAGRAAGSYRAFCGAELLGASLTDPGARHCLECARCSS